MQHWHAAEVNAPSGTRDPLVLHSDDGARGVLVVLTPGQELGEHQVKENAWLAVLEGEVMISAGSESIDGAVGTVVRFEPDERHSLSSAGGARVLLVLAPWPGDGHYRGER